MAYRIIWIILMLLGSGGAAAFAAAASAAGPASVPPTAAETLRTRAERQGMTIELKVAPVGGDDAATLLEGEYADLSLVVRDSSGRNPVTSLYPAVWVDQRKEFAGEKNRQQLTCEEKIRSYLKGGLSYRPDIDLNSYYILALNNDATVSVIDPIMGVAGFSQMYKMILLRSPGADWSAGPDEKTLFVTMPKSGQVAMVDLERFAVHENLPAGDQPTRIVLQPDGRYLWVGNDSRSAFGGVTVLDSVRGIVAASIPTAPGRHDIVISDDSLTVFVLNRDAGTVAVIDTQTLQQVREIKTGPRPVSLAYSSLSKAAYVADEQEGTITVIDGVRREVARVVRDLPGLGAIRFAPGDRWGVILNRVKDTALVLDASSDAVVYREPVGRDPEQVAFSAAFAYIRSRGTAEVTLLALESLGRGDRVTALKVSGGSRSPSESSYLPAAGDSITPTPEGNSVVIASPADATIIYYMEGMAVPLGAYKNSGRTPRALKTLNRSLRETAPGVYSSRIKIPRDGIYDVMFLLDSPRISECFSFRAAPNPALKKMKSEQSVRLEFLPMERTVKSGLPVTVKVRLLDDLTGVPLTQRMELTVLPTLTPYGKWQERRTATLTGGGVYEVTFTPPEAGLYRIYFSLAPAGPGISQLPFLNLQAVSP